MTLRSLDRRSRSASASDGHRNLVNSAASGLQKGFEQKLKTNISYVRPQIVEVFKVMGSKVKVTENISQNAFA